MTVGQPTRQPIPGGVDLPRFPCVPAGDGDELWLLTIGSSAPSVVRQGERVPGADGNDPTREGCLMGQSVASRAEQKKPRQFPEGKGGEESTQHTAGISPEAVEHIGYLILHRTNPDELRVTLVPDRCPLCREIAAWGLGRG